MHFVIYTIIMMMIIIIIVIDTFQFLWSTVHITEQML